MVAVRLLATSGTRVLTNPSTKARLVSDLDGIVLVVVLPQARKRRDVLWEIPRCVFKRTPELLSDFSPQVRRQAGGSEEMLGLIDEQVELAALPYSESAPKLIWPERAAPIRSSGFSPSSLLECHSPSPIAVLEVAETSDKRPTQMGYRELRGIVA